MGCPPCPNQSSSILRPRVGESQAVYSRCIEAGLPFRSVSRGYCHTRSPPGPEHYPPGQAGGSDGLCGNSGDRIAIWPVARYSLRNDGRLGARRPAILRLSRSRRLGRVSLARPHRPRRSHRLHPVRSGSAGLATGARIRPGEAGRAVSRPSAGAYGGVRRFSRARPPVSRRQHSPAVLRTGSTESGSPPASSQSSPPRP